MSRVVAQENGSTGISAHRDSLVTASIAEGNGGTGISVDQATVRECNSSLNGGSGIQMTFAATIHGNTLRNNGGKGIRASGPGQAMVTDNYVEGSNEHGIRVGVPSSVTGNHVVGSGGCGVAFVGGTAGLTGVLGGNSLLDNNKAGGVRVPERSGSSRATRWRPSAT